MSATWLTLEEAAARAGRPVEEIREALLMGELVGRPTDDGGSHLVTAESLEAHYGLSGPPPTAPRWREFVRPVVGGMLFGACAGVAPNVFGLVAIVLWFVVLFRSPVAGVSAAAVMVAAVLAPVKYVDTIKFKELSSENPTLAELSRAARPRMTIPEGMDELRLQVPGRRPSIRQVVDAIHAQTGLVCEVPCCGTSASLLTGGGPAFIIVRRK